jgi:predicted transcriptional regulator of viral defense system
MLDALVTTAQAALFLGVTAALIRKWASRGLLRAVKRGVYRLGDAIKAEAQTRKTVKTRGGVVRKAPAQAVLA